MAAIPAGVPDGQAATFPTAGLTALRALEAGGLLLDRRMLVTGAPGGVGRMAVQLARASGADVTAPVRDAARSGALLGRLGAAAVVEDPGGDFDVIIDGVGGATFGLAIEHLRPRGILVNIATPDEEEMVSFRAVRFDRARGAAICMLDPSGRACRPRQRGQRSDPAVRAGRRRTAGRPDRARMLMAPARTGDRRPAEPPHRRQGGAPGRLTLNPGNH
jgi:NADPH:quinone reductase-like Zn-dependent oxidoreductase